MSTDEARDVRKGPQRYDAVLIQKPHRQAPGRRAAWGVVTVGFWLFYLSLWAPLVTLIAWGLGINLAWLHLYEHRQQLDPFLMIALPLMALACAVVLITWAEYNRRRFRGRERRQPVPDIAIEKIAHDLGGSDALVAGLATSKSVILHMDDQARPAGFTIQQTLPTS